MIQIKGYAAQSSSGGLAAFHFERSEPEPQDVVISILYCGICHADIHQSRNEYGNTIYPFVPGHEIVGKVVRVGDKVTRFGEGDLVGVGYFISSCRHCSSCKEGEEQFCENGILPTQNGKLPGGATTKGGYSDFIVVNENYVLSISEKLVPASAAPLLCAGITAFSALRHYDVRPGNKVAVTGLGGIGHLVVKFAASFGAEVTVVSTSIEKRESAFALGAHHFINTRDQGGLRQVARSFDFIVNTISASHNYNLYLNLLKKNGTMIVTGRPPEVPQIDPGMLVTQRRKIGGTFIGGLEETQQMLDYCAEKGIGADIELIKPTEINQAFDRVLKGDVKYRFVVDMTGIKP